MNKNYIKKTLGPRLLAAMLFFSAFSTVSGQELIKEIGSNYYLCDTSIIGVYDDSTVVICNRRNDSKSTFMLVNLGSANVPTLYLDSILVNDIKL